MTTDEQLHLPGFPLAGRNGSGPARGKRVELRMPGDLLAALDHQAAQADDGAGVTRSEMIRRLLTDALDSNGHIAIAHSPGRYTVSTPQS